MSTQKTLRDANGNTIGYIETDSNGKQTLRDSHGNLLGYYDSNSNYTRDSNGTFIGEGNILTTLL